MLNTLLQETLSYLKKLPHKKQAFLATPEEWEFFQQRMPEPSLSVPSYARKELPPALPPAPPPVQTPVAAPVAAPQKPLLAKEKSSMRYELEKIAPSFVLHDAPLEDSRAKKIKEGYQEHLAGVEVVILDCNQEGNSLLFVKNFAKAIHERLAPVKILSASKLEEQKRWELFFERNHFRLIIATDQLQKFPLLMSHYRAVPAQSLTLLGGNPLLVLSSLSSYEDPAQKAQLWKAVCQLLKP